MILQLEAHPQESEHTGNEGSEETSELRIATAPTI